MDGLERFLDCIFVEFLEWVVACGPFTIALLNSNSEGLKTEGGICWGI
jgi:hypothetical protein